jgi:phage terminase small subunit
MAGVKGKSGGARQNSGGARPGAGRKPQPQEAKVTIVTTGRQTPLEFLLDVMNDNEVDDKLRLEAAKTAAQYVHAKKGEGGKKDEKQDAADKARAGKFAPSAPPRLIVNRG